MPNVLQNINKIIKRINKKIDKIQNTGGGIRLNTSEISFNTLRGENLKSIFVKLGEKPESDWVLKSFQTVTSSTKPSNIPEGVNNTYEGNTARRTVGYYEDNTNFTYEDYQLKRDDAKVTVKLTFDSPNPNLISVNPTELIFNDENWDREQEIQISLTDRIRYATEYYDKLKIISEVVTGLSTTYSTFEEYIDINIYSSNQRESYTKGREIYSLESYRHPVNYSIQKSLKIEKFQIIGSIVGGHFTAYPVIKFGDKYYNKKRPDIIQIIAQTLGTSADLIMVPGSIPEYASPESPPLEPTHYAIVGIDGRIFRSNGSPEISKHTNLFPNKIKISISDKKIYEFDLSDFTTVSSPPPVSSQCNFGPLDSGVIEISVDEEFTADELTKIMPNGDSTFYIYSTLDGESPNFLNLQSVCNIGFLLYRPFVLKPVISHTKNVWDTNRGTITHTFIQRCDAKTIQYLDTSNKFEKRSGYTIFNMDYYAPELYFKYFYDKFSEDFDRVYFKGLIYDENNFSELANLIDPNVNIISYYTSLEDQFPQISNRWFTHSETPFVHVDYQSNIGYTFFKNKLNTNNEMEVFSGPTEKSFNFERSSPLRENPSIKCDTSVITRNKLQIIDFA